MEVGIHEDVRAGLSAKIRLFSTREECFFQSMSTCRLRIEGLPTLVLAILFLAGFSSIPLHSATSADSPASIPILLGLVPVRQDLRLSPLQCGLLDSLQTAYQSRAGKITAIGMADQDAALRANWDLQSLRMQFNRQALDVLSSSQQDRLMQIQRQMLGGSLLASPSEQKLLGLTPGQQKSLAAISAAEQQKLNALAAQAQAGKVSGFRKGIELRGIQQQTAKNMMAVLTTEQRNEWKILSGQKSGMPEVHDPDASAKSLFGGY